MTSFLMSVSHATLVSHIRNTGSYVNDDIMEHIHNDIVSVPLHNIIRHCQILKA